MLIIQVTIVLGLLLFPAKESNENGADVVQKLEELGYFKYTDAKRIGDLKADLIKSFDQYKVLSTLSDYETLLPCDYRLYFCDGEALFEIGGLEEYLGYAKHAFEKRGLRLEWSNEVSEEKGNHWDHRITVNGKEYIAFKGTMERMDIWGIAQLNFYRLLNDQLEIQGSDERVYPISGGEDGQYVFLTTELFDYISATFYQGKDFRKWDIPYPVERWREIHGLK
jgi:hypothetical protein